MQVALKNEDAVSAIPLRKVKLDLHKSVRFQIGQDHLVANLGRIIMISTCKNSIESFALVGEFKH